MSEKVNHIFVKYGSGLHTLLQKHNPEKDLIFSNLIKGHDIAVIEVKFFEIPQMANFARIILPGGQNAFFIPLASPDLIAMGVEKLDQDQEEQSGRIPSLA